MNNIFAQINLGLYKCLTLDRFQTRLNLFSLNRHFQPAGTDTKHHNPRRCHWAELTQAFSPLSSYIATIRVNPQNLSNPCCYLCAKKHNKHD